MNKVGARVWIARIMVTWGIISAAFMFTSSETVFYVLRFLLGVAEAGFFPGIILYLTAWYPAHRRAKIITIFMSAIPISAIFGNPLSGLLMDSFHGTHGLSGWQWMFLIEAIPAHPVRRRHVLLPRRYDPRRRSGWTKTKSAC